MTRTPTSSIYLIVLDKDDPSPLSPQSDEEADRSKADGPKPADGAAPAKPESAPRHRVRRLLVRRLRVRRLRAAAPAVTIDFDNILQRVLALPMPPRAYMTLQTGKAGTLVALEAPLSAPGTPGPGLTVHRFDLQQRRADTPLNGVRQFQIAHNGEKILYTQGQGETLRWMIGTLRPLPPAGAGGPPGPPPGDGGAKVLQTADTK